VALASQNAGIDQEDNTMLLTGTTQPRISDDPRSPEPPARAGAAFADFAQLILDISRSFVNLPQAEVDAGIDKALDIIGQYAGALRCYIYEFSDEDMMMDCIHEWYAPGIASHRGSLSRVPLSDIPWIAYTLRRGDLLSIPSITEMPPEAEIDRRTLEKTGLSSFAFVPMLCCSNLTGFLGLGPLPADPGRQDETLALLRVAAEMFSNALEQKKTEHGRRVGEWLHDILTVMNSTKPLEEILSHMVTRAGQLLEADAAVIFRVDAAGHMLTIEALCGMPAECALGLRLPYGDGDVEPMTSIARGQPFAVADFAARLVSVQRQPAGYPPEFMAWTELMARHFAAYVAVPLMIQDAPYGMLVVLPGATPDHFPGHPSGDERGAPGRPGHRERPAAPAGRADRRGDRTQPAEPRAARFGDAIALQRDAVGRSGDPPAARRQRVGGRHTSGRAARHGPGSPARDAAADL